MSASSAGPHYTVLYESGGFSPVRMLNVLALSFSVAGLGLALVLLTAPSHVLVNDQSPVGWAVFMGVAAVGCPIAAWWYNRRIAARLLLSADGRTLRIYEPTLLGFTEREIDVGDIRLAEERSGDSSGEEALSAARLKVEVVGQRGFVVPLRRNHGRQRQHLVEVLQRRA